MKLDNSSAAVLAIALFLTSSLVVVTSDTIRLA